MGRYILVVPSAALPGRDDEYNRWYDDTHIRDLCAIPGITAGRRYEARPAMTQSAAPPPGPYLAIYEIETEDPAGVLAELNRRAAAGEMEISSALDVPSAHMWFYEAR